MEQGGGVIMNFLNRCNGRHEPCKKLSEASFQLYCQHASKARADFGSLGNGATTFDYNTRSYHLGRRFLDDNAVLCRIESALSGGLFQKPVADIDIDAEFQKDPYAWCLDALRDCASADHWYTFEKDYG
jgi:hypothetical protein